MFSVVIKERGLPIGLMKRAFRRAKKDAFASTADEFHQRYVFRRFTTEHAARAGYAKRRGENIPSSDPRFSRFYFGRKFLSEFGGGVGVALPLVYSGVSRMRARRPSLRATSNGATLRYSVNAFNFKSPGSRVDKRKDFNKVLASERRESGRAFDEFMLLAVRAQRFQKSRRLTG